MSNEQLEGFDDWFGGCEWRFDFEHSLVSIWNGERWVPIDEFSTTDWQLPTVSFDAIDKRLNQLIDNVDPDDVIRWTPRGTRDES